MEKNQYKLCVEVLKRLEQAGVLKEILEHRKSTLPAALVRHGSRSVYFVMDEGAASLLTVTRT